MRKEHGVSIINISSIAGRIALPMYSAYVSTKFAIEGLSESMAYELEPFGIKVAIIEPGAIKTNFRREQAAVGNLGIESVLKRRDFYVDNWDDHTLTKMMEEGGVQIIRGHGRLDGRKRVIVNSNDGVSTILVARHAVVLSTGSRSTIPDVPGLVQASPWSSRNATSAKKVPQRLAILGDGTVACEMADIWSSLGAKVTLLSCHEKILERFEPFVGDQLAMAFTKRGITIRTKVNIVQVKRSNPNEPVQIQLDNGTKIEADELLVAVGRTPKTGDLGLETVDLKSQQWLNVDDTCLVQGLGENNWLYAIGDINRRALLTHLGKYQGRACAKAILARARGTVIDDHSKWSQSTATADHDMTPTNSNKINGMTPLLKIS
ncbi:MAG: SDR family NAD(P)-dependent oxidoreductase [Candidatus Sulfotelmatobacter sp.]